MSILTLQPAAPLAADGAALAHVLQRAGVSRNSLIRVTGPAGPTAMLWLGRNGYRRTVYARAISGGAQTEPADAWLVPHACSKAELAELLESVEALRDGGVLILQAAARRTAEDGDGVLGLLHAFDFQIELSLVDRGRIVYVARRQGLGGFRQAA